MLKKVFGLKRLEDDIARLQAHIQALQDGIGIRNDALDHILRTAESASVVTERLQFIADRARVAKLGQVWDNNAPRRYASANWKILASRYLAQRDALLDELKAAVGHDKAMGIASRVQGDM